MSDDSNPRPGLAPPPQRDSTPGAPTWRVATFNVENYLDASSSRGGVKSAESKAKVRKCIRALRPDVLALQEVGSVAALMEFRAALKAEGLDFPHWEHVTGSDANVHVAILSRFPFSARHPHTDDCFELDGQRFRVRRGFAEVDVQVNPGCQLRCWARNTNSWANRNPPTLRQRTRPSHRQPRRSKASEVITRKVIRH
ncbi:MAG: endonuclease/exonuclease/phosphatase family protein [Verrucomicrobiota bacterium]|jgi:hypothetical protein